MYVYVLIEEMVYEGTTVLGTYSTLAKARKEGTGVLTSNRLMPHPHFARVSAVRSQPITWSTQKYRRAEDQWGDEYIRHIERHRLVQ